MALTDRQGELTGFPSVDKPWLKYFTESELKEKLPLRTIYQSVYQNNKDSCWSKAFMYFGNVISFLDLFRAVDDCTKSLLESGIKRGDCVTLCTAGIPEAIYLVLACSRIGAIANFINPLFSKEQMIERINETNADWIFILDEMYSLIEEALPRTCIKTVVIIPATNSVNSFLSKILFCRSKAKEILDKGASDRQLCLFNDFRKSGSEYRGELDLPFQADTPVVMVYSSGTTGASKGILLTNDGINATIQNYKREKWDRKDLFLSMIPVWFSTGIVLSCIMPLALGVCVIPEPKFSKESFARDLKKYKPSATLTATSLWKYVATAKETRHINLSKMKYPATGGEKITEKDEVALNEFLMKHRCTNQLQKGYGMCELGSAVSGTTSSEGYRSKMCSTGYPIINAVVSAFNIDTDEELKYKEHGEIRVCSPAHMKGYYKNPEATDKFFKTDKNGIIWGCTGDIGYVDEDGEVFILGRVTDSYKRESGETVYLFDIEDEIIKEESVNQCKVVDIEENRKTKLVAHIVFKEDTTREDVIIREIDEHLKNVLPGYMVPDYYKVRQSMPVHPNGKRDVEALKNDKEGLKSLGNA